MMGLFLSSQCYLCSNPLALNGLSRCLCDACIGDFALLSRYSHSEILNPFSGEASDIDRLVSQYAYQIPVSYLLKQLKYNNSLLLAHFFGRSLAEFILKTKQPLPEVLIAIPLHPKRMRIRGYNQALEIAKVVASYLKIPLLQSTLVRSRYTVPQTECSLEERQLNLAQSFAVQGELSFVSVALIDDVLTTGATLAEAAKVLKLAGVEQVSGWSCAQAGSL
ncbi:MAG: ComF family protein [Thiotrichaceae bacterium]|nr:ComF family protein [Thiotrichaceae bacterium]